MLPELAAMGKNIDLLLFYKGIIIIIGYKYNPIYLRWKNKIINMKINIITY